MKSIYLILSLLFCLGTAAAQSFTEIGGGLAVDASRKAQGVSFVDFDGDGDQDLHLTTRIGSDYLFSNQGDGTFNDVAAGVGLATGQHTRAATWGDFNNDGYIDLYLGINQQPDRIYLNNGPVNNGTFSFTDITASTGISGAFETNSVHLADIDNDGLLDIYVANYNADNVLYRNNGDLTFTDLTPSAGTRGRAHSMACAFLDYDRDGDQDLYLVHDFEQPNILYRNDGDGRFTDVGADAGANIVGHGMGLAVGDVNRDGWPDLYVTDLAENVLLLNGGDGTFTDVAADAGVADAGMGWSTFFLDYDNDGWSDLYVVNDTQFSPYPNALYHNNGDGTFAHMEPSGAISSPGAGIGGAAGDLNGDGFAEIVVANLFAGDGGQVFLNNANDNHFIGFDLNGNHTNASAIGARILIEYADGEQQSATVRAGTGFASANSLTQLFGLGDNAEVTRATVTWPDGAQQTLSDLAADRVYELVQATGPIVNNLTMTDSIVERYGKFETTVDVTADFTNPYDYDQVVVAATFTAPDGTETTVDGFFLQEFTLSTISGSLTPDGEGRFRVRFSPGSVGEWSYRVTVTDATGTTTGPTGNFRVTGASETNFGFVRTGASNYLEFDSGEQYIPIGENMAWEEGNAFRDYRRWLNKLEINGGNFIRLWHAHWGLGIEWRDGFANFDGLRRYQQNNSAYQDWLYDFCAEKGIYVMLTLQHHGPVSTRVNPNWGDSPYNVANGGPCASTSEFFTDPAALAHTKNRFRYIVARWGYSRAIQSWELFNEVNWTDDYEEHLDDVRAWHSEMIGYLESIDPYDHLITTSFAEPEQDPPTWNDPGIDFTQTHFYVNSPNLERALANGTRNYLEDYDKPTLTGEFGLSGNPDDSNGDPDGIHLHNSAWASLFGGGLGTGMTWWWDVYVEKNNLYYHFAPIRQVVDEIPFVNKNLRPVDSRVAGTPGALILTPSLGWGAMGDQDVTVNQDGTTTPENPGFSQYLYGSQWNTELRSPPTFTVEYPETAVFSVTTGNDRGTRSRISIYVNGVLALDEPAVQNTEFTVQVPAGRSEIRVDNLGTDWAIVTGYRFADLGSKVENYALQSEDGKVAAGWVLNHAYNHVNLTQNNTPPEVQIGAEIALPSMAAGTYYVKWYDCLTGEIQHSDELLVSATDSLTRFAVPDLAWDLAYRIDSETFVSTTSEAAVAGKLAAFPNPAIAGNVVHLPLPDTETRATADLFDATGRKLSSRSLGTDHVFTLSQNLPAGLYWLKIRQGTRKYSVTLMVK